MDKEKKFKVCLMRENVGSLCMYVHNTQGSIFTEFECIEDAEKFVKVEKVQFNGIDLVVEWK